MKRRWFLYFFKRSLSQRKGRVAIASLAVVLAVSIITSMISITSGVREKLGSELKAYGSNIIVSPGRGSSFPFETAEAIRRIDDVEYAVGQVFTTARLGKESIEIIGLDIAKLREAGWRVSGEWPQKEGEVLAGANLKAALKIKPDEIVSLEGEGGRTDFRVSGFVERGGAEDNAVIMPMASAWRLAGVNGVLNAVLVRGRAGGLDNLVSEIKRSLPEVSVKTFRQVASAEESLLSKMQLLMSLVTIVVLFAAAISVASTMGANILERREEIGLMKAIGATGSGIRIFYLAEALLVGFIGGTAGFILGVASAQAVSRGAFGSFIPAQWYLPLASLIIGLVISAGASYFPVRDVLKYNPAVILREE